MSPLLFIFTYEIFRNIMNVSSFLFYHCVNVKMQIYFHQISNVFSSLFYTLIIISAQFYPPPQKPKMKNVKKKNKTKKTIYEKQLQGEEMET